MALLIRKPTPYMDLSSNKLHAHPRLGVLLYPSRVPQCCTCSYRAHVLPITARLLVLAGHWPVGFISTPNKHSWWKFLGLIFQAQCLFCAQLCGGPTGLERTTLHCRLVFCVMCWVLSKMCSLSLFQGCLQPMTSALSLVAVAQQSPTTISSPLVQIRMHVWILHSHLHTHNTV